jgi:hypothetical protein
VKPRDRILLQKLHALLGSANAGERENAHAKILELLEKNRKSWNDLAELLQPSGTDQQEANDEAPPSKPTGAGIDALDLVHGLINDYVELKPYMADAMALWSLHTFVYSRFLITPRLALTSPVRGCGKTNTLALLELLTSRGRKDDSITPAAVIRLVDREHPTLLLDEADNLGLFHNGLLRAVFNSGHRRGGGRTLTERGRERRYSTFAPMAIASIGALPLPLMHRSVVVHMARATRKERQLHDVDPAIDAAHTLSMTWAREAELDPDPELPRQLSNRVADNWRVLVSVGDSVSPEWGRRARHAAIEFARTHHDEDAAVILLNDIRTVFDALGVDRIFSATLVEELVGIDDSLWSDWRGLHDDRQPRKLSQGELARLLALFRIRPRSVWIREHNKRHGQKGYWRADFESVWAQYCEPAGTPAQTSGISKLRRA